MTPVEIEQMKADRGAGTKGPWKCVALGGASTVLAPSRPVRNDTRIPAYGYDESAGHCLGYPFVADGGRTRWDFVCFSHADARRLGRVPDMEAEILRLREALEEVSELSRYARHGGATEGDLDNYERGLDEALRIADEALAGTKEDNA